MVRPNLNQEEHNRRLSIYKKHINSKKIPKEIYTLMGKEMFLSPKGVEGWIRRSGLKHPIGNRRKLQISKNITIWERTDGVVGDRVKNRSYIKNYPLRDRLIVRSFIRDLIDFSDKLEEPLKHKQISSFMENWEGRLRNDH